MAGPPAPAPAPSAPPYAPLYAYAPRYVPPSSGRSVLSIIWTIAIVLFLVWALLDFAGLLLSPAFVVPGVEGISSGSITNGDLAAGNANWTFVALSAGASGTLMASGGPAGASDRYLDIHLDPGTDNEGMWYQPFRVTGSEPFAGHVSLDVQVVSSGTFEGRLIVAVDNTLIGLNNSNAVAVVWYNTTSVWTRTASFEIAGAMTAPGSYFLKIAFDSLTATAPVDVGLDNIGLSWLTNEAVIVYLPLPDPVLPLPVLIGYTQDKIAFLTYYAVVIVVILGAGAYYLVRERALILRAVRAPLENTGARLRSRSAWIAVGQTWMAVTFAQFAIIAILALLAVPTPSPITQPTTGSVWTLLFDLANAPMYEELVFRALLIGVPMAIASILFRSTSGSKGGRDTLRTAFRYLIGGNLRSTSPRLALLGGWILLFASSTLFGAAHAPSWGSWKIVPAMIAGLGFGYLFLRHGIGAAILAHFVNDYAASLVYENVGGLGLDIATNSLLLALAAVGAGFFAWYVLYAWQHLQDLLSRYGVRLTGRPASAGPGPGGPLLLPPPVPMAAMSNPPPPPITARPPGPPARDLLSLPSGYAPAYRPPPYGYPPVRFQCPWCGWVEARYADGRFTCLRCGRTA